MPELNWVLKLQLYLDFLEHESQGLLASPPPRGLHDKERYASAKIILRRIPTVRRALQAHPDAAELAMRVLDLALRNHLPDLKMMVIYQFGLQKAAARQKAKHRGPSPRDKKMRALAARLASDLTTTAKAKIIRDRLTPKRRGHPLSVRQIRRIIAPEK